MHNFLIEWSNYFLHVGCLLLKSECTILVAKHKKAKTISQI